MTSDMAVREPVRDPDVGRGSGGGLGRIVRSGVGRRRVQTVVMTLTTLLAVTASVLAAGLLVASSAPFQHSFDRQRGAHLTAAFDSATVTEAQAGGDRARERRHGRGGSVRHRHAAPRTAGRSSGAGTPGAPELPVGVDLPSATIVGRASAGGDLDRLDIIEGRWATESGEIVWADGTMPVQVGDRLTFPSAPGSPTLTVVGLARSIGKTAQAWALPSQLTAMRGPGVISGIQMLYRFAHATTDDDIAADRAVIAAAVPAGGLTGTSSYLTVKQGAERTAATFAPFVIAFGVLGLVMSVLIIGIVVSGAVSSATRRIGILKSLGFTPSQVARAYVAQALIPSVIGAGLGVLLGNLAAIPVLRDEGDAFGTGVGGLAPWVSVVVPIGALLLVALTALVPALRAARLRTVDAIAVGRTPAAGRGRRVRRVPRAAAAGAVAEPRTRQPVHPAGPVRDDRGRGDAGRARRHLRHRPGRLARRHPASGLNQREAGDVVVYTQIPPQGAGPGPVKIGPGPDREPPATDMAAVTRRDPGAPGTERYFGTDRTEVNVAGLSGSTQVVTFSGDASWASYQMIDGRWFAGPGRGRGADRVPAPRPAYASATASRSPRRRSQRHRDGSSARCSICSDDGQSSHHRRRVAGILGDRDRRSGRVPHRSQARHQPQVLRGSAEQDTAVAERRGRGEHRRDQQHRGRDGHARRDADACCWSRSPGSAC